MRRQNKILNQQNRAALNQHKLLIEDERGWAGQHGQHPKNIEEENYRPALNASDSHSEEKQS